MRARVICFVLICTLASAETIRLKNGRTILADKVREANGRVEYEIGDDTYAIPKALVERIDAGGVPVRGAAASDLPAFTPSEELKNTEQLTLSVIREGRVDQEALAALDRGGNAQLAAAGYFLAGRFEHDRGNRERARFYFDRALVFAPDNAIILSHFAAELVQMGRANDALPYAERAARAAPTSFDAQAVLGFVYFASDKSKEAVRAWKRALELRPDARIESLIAKAERELNAESSYSQRESGHFTLRFEGRTTPESFGRAILATLEAHYDDLVRDLNVAPRASIPVILYTDQAFFDVTHAPSWIGAINDGKLRLPIHGVSSVDSEMSRVLKHELAHSFITHVSRGRCPQWLHEGIAQLLEPRRLHSEEGRALAKLFAMNRQIPLNALEGSFMRFSGLQAQIAYAESLAAAEYIRDTYGISDLQRILSRLGDGGSTEAALRTTIHAGYSDLEEQIGGYLKGRFGE